jgi:hypothetical protein
MILDRSFVTFLWLQLYVEGCGAKLTRSTRAQQQQPLTSNKPRQDSLYLTEVAFPMLPRCSVYHTPSRYSIEGINVEGS